MKNEYVMSHLNVKIGNDEPRRLALLHKETIAEMFGESVPVPTMIFDNKTDEANAVNQWWTTNFGSHRIQKWDLDETTTAFGVLLDLSTKLFNIMVKNGMSDDELKECIRKVNWFVVSLWKERTTNKYDVDKNAESLFESLADSYMNGKSGGTTHYAEDSLYKASIDFLFDWMYEEVMLNGENVCHRIDTFHKGVEFSDIYQMANNYHYKTLNWVMLNDTKLEQMESYEERFAFTEKIQMVELNCWIEDLYQINNGKRLAYLQVQAKERELEELSAAQIAERENQRIRRAEMRQAKREREKEAREAQALLDAQRVAQAHSEREEKVVEDWHGWNYKERFRFIKKLFGF